MSSANYERFLGCDCPYDQSRTALFGAPFDATASFRPGARFGPRAIRAESFGIETYSPYREMDLEDLRVFDGGDVDLPFGGVAAALSLLEERAAVYLRDGKRPVMLGGEHLATLAPVRAALAVYPDLRVIQFDAHADLRDEYLGERYSHATVMRRVCELAGDGRVYQFGIRSGLRDEFDFAREHTVMRKYDFDGLRDTVRGLDGLPVYITIDLDVLDPSVLPGTGTPEPAGVTFRLLLDAISALESARIVGADIVELSPHYDLSGVSAVTACVALRELLLTIG